MGKVIDYLDIYNKLWEHGEYATYEDVKKRNHLHLWALNEDRRKALYNVDDITKLEF